MREVFRGLEKPAGQKMVNLKTRATCGYGSGLGSEIRTEFW